MISMFSDIKVNPLIPDNPGRRSIMFDSVGNRNSRRKKSVATSPTIALPLMREDSKEHSKLNELVFERWTTS